MNDYLVDILDQPQSLRAALEGYAAYEGALDALAASRPERILFTGMGSSHFCSHGASLHLVSRGYTSLVVSAGQVLHYEQALVNSGALLVAISQSGESAETASLVAALPEAVRVVAVTNSPASTLGLRGDPTLCLGVRGEVSVTTRTYMASLILTNLVARAITGCSSQAFRASALEALASLEGFLSQYADASARMLEFLGRAPKYICLMGRGYSASSVRAGALFIREVAKMPAIDFDSAEFRHGPIEMVDSDFAAVVFAPAGPTFALNRDLALSIAQKGGKCVLITNCDAGPTPRGVLPVQLDRTAEDVSPLADIGPVQLLASSLAEARGLVPGAFRWCTKVTTEE